MLLSEIDLKRKKHEKESFYKYIIRVRVILVEILTKKKNIIVISYEKVRMTFFLTTFSSDIYLYIYLSDSVSSF
jgi:hypothetical protein